MNKRKIIFYSALACAAILGSAVIRDNLLNEKKESNLDYVVSEFPGCLGLDGIQGPISNIPYFVSSDISFGPGSVPSEHRVRY